MSRAAASAKGARRPRPGTLEREARRAAAAGPQARDLARGLSRTPAAPRPAVTGIGQRLPDSLRGSAEQAFGADFGAVRLHHNVTGLAGTGAATAGADILLADRALPAGEGGRQLLFHELAHVLQQTGRAGADGRPQARRLHGTGSMHANGGELLGPNAPATDDLLAHLIRVHRRGRSDTDLETSDPDLADVIALVQSRFAGGYSVYVPNLAAKALEAEVLTDKVPELVKPVKKLSQHARGLLFDVLKFAGSNDGAFLLLDDCCKLETVNTWGPFFHYLGTRVPDLGAWAADVLDCDPSLGAFLTTVMPATYWNYLIDPDRLIQSLYNFKERVEADTKAAEDWEVLGGNERHAAAIQVIDFLDKLRIKELVDAEGKAKKSGLKGTRLKFHLSSSLSVLAQEKLKIPGQPPVLLKSHENINAVIDRALAYWTAVFVGLGERDEKLNLTTYSQVTDELRAELRAPLPDVPAITKMRAEVESGAAKLLALEADKAFPSRSSYTQRVIAFRSTVNRLKGSIAEELRKGLPRTADPASEPGFEALGMVVRRLEDLEVLLESYDPKADKEMESLNGAIDVRLHHRLRMARRLHSFAMLIGSAPLEATVADLLSGKDRGDSTLILISDWNEQQEVLFTDLSKDFPILSDQEFPGVETQPGQYVRLPFTLYQLMKFFRLVYDRALVKAINDLLAVTPTTFDPKRKPILYQAYQRAANAELPKRWHVAETEIVLLPGDEVRIADIISLHPKTKAQLLPLRDPLGALITAERLSFSKDRKPEIFAWQIPSYNMLIDELKKIDAFNAMIGPTIEEARKLPTLDWMTRFMEVSPNFDMLELDVALDTQIEGERKDAKKKLETLIPAAVNHERVSVTGFLAEALLKYADDNIVHYGKPNDVLEYIKSFIRFVQPNKDVGPQTAALIVALAPAIKTAFSSVGLFGTEFSETRFDIITGYMGLLKFAARMTEEANWPKVQRVLGPAEEGAQTDGKIDHVAANAQLKYIIRRFEEQAEKIAEKVSMRTDGFVGLKSNYSAHTVKVGEPFDSHDQAWSIRKIHQEFVFLPPYGQGDNQVRPATLLTGDRKPMVSSGKPLLTIRIDKNEIDITDELSGRNLEMLERLTRIVAGRSLQLSFQNSLAVMEAIGNFVMDLVECIPGAGQAVMAARIIAQVAEFFGSGKFEEIVSLLRGDPIEFLRDVIDKLDTDFLRPDPIWEYMLFDSPALDTMKKKGEENHERGRRSKHKGGKIGRVIRTITKLGITVHDKINGVKQRIEPRVRTVQTFVQARPLVGSAIHFGILLATSPGISRPAELAGALAGGADEEKIGDRLSELVQSVNDFELPQDLINNTAVVDAILEIIIDIIARGCVGFAVETFLDVSGLREQIASDIAAALAGSAADPNVLWREEFRPKLEGAVSDAKTQFIESVTNVLGPLGIGNFNPPVATDLGRADFLEMEGHEASPGAGPPPAAAIGTGRPLPAPLRHSAERGFGHDFGHVRLHADDAAGALTRHYGADALTSGSHVMLAPGLDPERGTGRRVLDHELGHVLQQAGPRPLGRRMPERPVSGRQGRGLCLDRSAEREADRVAAAAEAPGDRVGRPLAVTARDRNGLAPSLGGPTFARILRKFTEVKEVSEFRKDVETQAMTTMTADHLTEAKKIWDDTLETLRENARAERGFRGNTGDSGIPDAIKDYLNQTGDGRPRNDVVKVLPVLTKKAEKTKGKPPNEHTDFSARLFANLLEGYVFARSGVSLNIALNKLHKVASLKVLSVDLGRAGPTSGLWSEARDRTNAHIATQQASKPHWKQLDEREWTKLGNMLRNGPPIADLMHHSQFRIGDDRLEQFFLFLAQATNASVPEWNNYVQTGTYAAQGEHRLRVGTHKQLTQEVNISGRESHHIPQFLLVQYFRNQADKPLFGDAKHPRLPGFTPDTAAEPTAFSDGSHSIDLAALNSGKKSSTSNRGMGMAAISLLATTHETAGLHVGLSKSWNEDLETNSSQGNTIEHEFQTRLIAATGQGDYEAAARWTNEPKQKTAGPKAVFTAMSGVYDWMYRDLMRPALIMGLQDEESRFYATIANSQGGATDPATKLLLPQYDPMHGAGRLNDVLDAVDDIQKTNPISGFRG